MCQKQRQGRGKGSDTNPLLATQPCRAPGHSSNAGEEIQLPLAFSLDQDGAVSLCVSWGYFAFGGLR